MVIGHTIPGKTTQIIFCFHMPLFFLLSGFLSQPQNDVKAYFTKKTFQLLVPYAVFLILFEWKTLFLFASDCWHLNILNEATLALYSKKLLIMIYGGAYFKRNVGVFWFITCLFITQQLFNYLIIRLTRNKVIILCSVSYFLSFINQYYLPEFYFPLAGNVVFAALPFYAIGYYSKNIGKINMLLLSIIILTGVTMVFLGFDIEYQMKYSYYGFPLVSCVLAVCTTIYLKCISEILNRLLIVGWLLGLVGICSKVVMFLHRPVLNLITNDLHSGNYVIGILCATGAPVLFYLLCTNFPMSRLLFLGESKKYDVISGNYVDTEKE